MIGLLQDITIYHKNNNTYTRYNVKASYRQTSILNRNNTGVETTDSVLIRIFDIDNNSFEVEKDDIVVNKNVSNTITDTPLTTLQALYGKNNVFKVKSVDRYRFEDSDISELNHTKIGLI